MPDVEEQESSKALAWYGAILACLFQIAWLVTWLQGTLLESGYPYNSLFFNPAARFSDFTIYLSRFQAWLRGADFFSLPGHPFTYPAPCFYGFALFIWLFAAPALFYLVFVALSAMGGALLVVRAARAHTTAIAVTCLTLFFSYPFLYLLDRGNIEGVVWVVLFGGMVLFSRQRYYSAAGLIGLAGAMKIFPALLLLLLLSRRRYRELAFGAGTAIVVSAVSLVALGPQAVSRGLEYFRQEYALKIRVAEIGFDHSLFALIKQALLGWRAERLLPAIAVPYTAATLVGFALLYWFRLRRMPLLNQLFGCSVAMVTLPFVSYDYTLVHVYLPWGFLIVSMAKSRVCDTAHRYWAFLLPCAVVFSPQTWLYMNSVPLNGFCKTAALLALIWAASQYPLPSVAFQENPSDAGGAGSKSSRPVRAGIMRSGRTKGK